MRYRNREKRAPVSTLRVARGFPEEPVSRAETVCHPTGAFLHAHDTADVVWPGVPGPVVVPE
ncbi:MAG: hypothetical protein NTZ37_02485 [Methanoregula sp.]|jgi:hypothetical protein|nr:hypothetical protein [Methanoregula sp.]